MQYLVAIATSNRSRLDVT